MENLSEDHLRSYVYSQHRVYPEYSSRKIAEDVKRDHQWVLRWWNRENSLNLDRGCGLTRNSPPKLSQSDLTFIKRNMKGTRSASGGDRKRKLSVSEVVTKLSFERGVDVCDETVRKAAHAMDLGYKRPRKKPRLKRDFAARRLKFAKEMTGFNWNSILNSDSSPFYLKSVANSQNDGTWVDSNDPDDVPELIEDKYTLKTEVYVGVCSRGITGPVFIDSPETVCAANYVHDVLPAIAASVKSRTKRTNDPTTTKLFQNPGRFLFQQDLASAHRSNLSQQWCRDNLHSFIPKQKTPPAFVEWPVENFFSELKRRVYKLGRPTTLSILKRRVRRICRDPELFEWLKSTFDSMPNRIQAIIDADGWHTRY
jgi:transposase